jgi:hypothetical protein
MNKILRKVKKTVDKTMPDKKEMINPRHPRRDYLLLLGINFLVSVAALLFVLSFFFDDAHHTLRGIAYFCGAGAYGLECLLITNFFKIKVPHEELFMIYCFGPVYILMGIGYFLG